MTHEPNAPRAAACTLLPHDVRLDCAAHATVLDAALAAGLSVPFSCRRGACGSCEAEVLSGEHERAFPPAPGGFEPGPGRLLMCRTRPCGELALRIPDWQPRPPRAPAAPSHEWEHVGARFEHAGIVAARARSIDAVHDIAARLEPGMTTSEAVALADARLRALGARRRWHPTYVRFGPDTTCTWREPGDRARRLREDDILFIDIGPVWGDHEGDYGDTFVLGDDAGHHRVAQAARAVFADAREAWRGGLDGRALYAHAAERAREHGCVLVEEIGGHRISDFPHALHSRQQLSQAGFAPTPGLWVLEIQLRDRERPIGAFFEDVLLREPAAA